MHATEAFDRGLAKLITFQHRKPVGEFLQVRCKFISPLVSHKHRRDGCKPHAFIVKFGMPTDLAHNPLRLSRAIDFRLKTVGGACDACGLSARWGRTQPRASQLSPHVTASDRPA